MPPPQSSDGEFYDDSTLETDNSDGQQSDSDSSDSSSSDSEGEAGGSGRRGRLLKSWAAEDALSFELPPDVLPTPCHSFSSPTMPCRD